MKPKERVLFIHIDFYDYNERIKNKIRELGYELDSFCEDPQINFVDKVIKRFKPEIIDFKSDKEQNELIDRIKKNGIQYDYVFVIKGERLKKEFLSELKRISPKAKFLLYMWDDVARVINFIENKEIYDEIYSFDRMDIEKYDLKFLPLFYCDDFITKKDNLKDIDLFFSGWMHSDRRNIIERILPVLKKNKMNYYVHLYTGRLKIIKDRLMKMEFVKNPEYIKYKKISIEKNAVLTNRSRIILDIQHYTQNGLTMRVFEALSAKCKIITTNIDIKNYDFYNQNNILIIDRNNPEINEEFLTSPIKDIPDDIVNRYSLENWIRTIIN